MGTADGRPTAATVLASAVAAVVVAAAAPLPPEATESLVLPFDPWLIAAPVIALGAIAVSWRWPGTRRWIAVLAILLAGVGVAMYALLIGALSTMGTSGDVPPAALLAALAAAGIGLIGASFVAFRRPRHQR